MRRFYEEVGRRLREARVEAGLTQQQLADRVGLSRASIANIEAGRQQVLAHVLNAAAAELGREPAGLLPLGGRVPWEPSDELESEDALERDLEDLAPDAQRWVRRVIAPAGPR